MTGRDFIRANAPPALAASTTASTRLPIAAEEVWNKFLLSPLEYAKYWTAYRETAHQGFPLPEGGGEACLREVNRRFELILPGA
jgi:hypothetical protein